MGKKRKRAPSKEEVISVIDSILDKQTHERGLIPPRVMAALRNQPVE